MRKKISFFVLWYLRFFARLQIKKIKPKIIGVGGASGKTSLSNFISIILSTKYKVRQSKGKNSETGIPINILKLPIKNYSNTDWLKAMILSQLRLIFDWEKYDYYVAEMGIDSPLEPKNMTYLLKIISPDIGVLTNISYEHSQYFDPLVEEDDVLKRQKDILDLTSQQEGLLLTSLDKDKTVILNIDDKNIENLKNEIKAKIITVSKKDRSSDFYIENIKNFVDKFVVQFRHEGKRFELRIENSLPDHFAYTFLLAIAACSQSVPIEVATKALLTNFSIPPGRMSVFKGIKDTVIIDSSYNNATLTPILDLLSFVADIGKQRRRIAVIGDMRELGTMSKSLHEEVARKILKTLDMVVLIGPLSQKYVLPVLKRNDFPVFSFLNFTSSKATILELIKPKDVILIKGSQNTLFLERAVEMLLENAEDRKKLCRRGEYWDQIRQKTL